MKPFSHDNSFVMNQLKIPSLKAVRESRDALHLYKLLHSLIDCDDLTDLFITRNISYDLRRPKMLLEKTYRTNYSHFPTIPRLLREQNKLLVSISSETSLPTFKRLIKNHLFKFS